MERGIFGKVDLPLPERWMGSRVLCEEMCSYGDWRSGSIRRHKSPHPWFVLNCWALPTSRYTSKQTKGLVTSSSLRTTSSENSRAVLPS